MNASVKRDEWTGETEEKRDHLDFAMRITANLYGAAREEVTSRFKSMSHGVKRVFRNKYLSRDYIYPSVNRRLTVLTRV